MTTIVVYRYDDRAKGEYGFWRKDVFDREEDAIVPRVGDIVTANAQFIEGEAKVIAIDDSVEASPSLTLERRFIVVMVERI